MPEHKFIDLSFTYKPDKDWYISLYGKNLSEVTVGTWAAASAIQGGTQFATYTDPRTYGIMFGTNF